ncbi:uncharacterized protein L969DRAFT_96506 [Mixia osmundae IAM 14324]|uniref:UNC-45/Cro1/She4 central domain-containing protein n=1 Tax=Mixia osmundae (strain CBS 9802 / IAM 14324 / JCM 22182 / KY 12970) TaxID=764103 RepID=G7DUU4_MIXOS|nr:uncharacterized protein L969DRAFT_96506 [Mixia osmundae IAM 14324]KEI37428.1 hypothetical protein L969DRAFT_96506 [Mixia osmundae IAM 14324]GAA94354.1 hypothetical protein E5Q_01005 [Mixia osmundae IAM 14324]
MNEVDALRVALEGEKWQDASEIAERLASELAQVSTRAASASTTLVETVIHHLRRHTAAEVEPRARAEGQLLRVLGNYCIDNDVNRQHLLDNDVLSCISPFMLLDQPASIDALAAQRTSVGILLNLTLDYAPAQDALAARSRSDNCLDAMLTLLASDATPEPLPLWICSIVSDVFSEEPRRNAIPIVQVVAGLIARINLLPASSLSEDHLEVPLELTQIVEASTEQSARLLAELATSEQPVTLARALHRLSCLCAQQTLAEQLGKSTQALREGLIKVLVALASEDACARFDPNSLGLEILPWISSYKQQAQTVGAASANELASCALLILANCAKTEERSSLIASLDGLLDSVQRLLAVGIDPATPSLQLCYGAMGLLRRLAVAPALRAQLGTRANLEGAATLLSDTFRLAQPLQDVALGFLRLCCTKQVQSAALLAMYHLDAVMAFNAQTDVPKLRLESFRAVAQAIQSIFSSATEGGFVSEARAELAKPPVLVYMIDMLHCSAGFPSLILEAANALIMLASAKALQEDMQILLINTRAATSSRSAQSSFDLLSDFVSDTNSPEEVRATSCNLLSLAIAGSSTPLPQDAREKLLSALNTCIESPQPSLRSAARTLAGLVGGHA